MIKRGLVILMAVLLISNINIYFVNGAALEYNFSEIKLKPSSHIGGEDTNVEIVIETRDIEDGTVISALLLDDSNDVVDDVNVSSTTINNNYGRLHLFVPSSVAAGEYKIRLAIPSENIIQYRNYRIEADIIAPSVRNVVLNYEGDLRVDVYTENVQDDSYVNVKLANSNNEVLLGELGDIFDNHYVTSLDVSSLAYGDYKVQVAVQNVPDEYEITFSKSRENPPEENLDEGSGEESNEDSSRGSNRSSSRSSSKDSSPSGTTEELEASPTKVERSMTVNQDNEVVIENKVKLEIPKGALAEDTTLKVELVEDTSDIILEKEEFKLVSEVFQFTTGNNRNFEKPIKISFNFNQDSVEDADKLGIYYYHEGRGAWIFLGGEVDVEGGMIEVEVDHFTKFAVFFNENIVELKDIENHWSRAYVNRLAGMEIVNGVEDGLGGYNYHPHNNITREEFAKIIAIALDLDVSETGNLPFSDVEAMQLWATPYIATVYEAGIITGTVDEEGNRYFHPSQNITRAEVATMIGRSMEEDILGKISFKDETDIPEWALEHVRTVAGKQIVGGYLDNTFRPYNNATRGEVAKMIVMMLQSLL